MLAIDVFTVFIVAVVVFIAVFALVFVQIAKGAKGGGSPTRSSSPLDDPTDTSWMTRGDDATAGPD